MSPFLFLVFLYLLALSFLVAILCLPMPSNAVRGLVIRALPDLWKRSQPVRFFTFIMALINAYYFYESMSYQDNYSNMTEGKQDHIRLFIEQRNAYLSGAGLFLTFTLYRLVELHSQLHDAREVVKGSEGKIVDDKMPTPTAPPMQ
eukprot:Rhum_TRINITY_DN10576_c0_g1::Rhum_TRINITY_DN10576_c0_g1_i1::g.39108::m.39108